MGFGEGYDLYASRGKNWENETTISRLIAVTASCVKPEGGWSLKPVWTLLFRIFVQTYHCEPILIGCSIAIWVRATLSHLLFCPIGRIAITRVYRNCLMSACYFSQALVVSICLSTWKDNKRWTTRASNGILIVKEPKTQTIANVFIVFNACFSESVPICWFRCSRNYQCNNRTRVTKTLSNKLDIARKDPLRNACYGTCPFLRVERKLAKAHSHYGWSLLRMPKVKDSIASIL